MKKTIHIIALLILIAGFAQSCRECAINGELDAQWQVTHVLYADGEESTPQALYLSFYRHTVQFTAPPRDKYTGNMAYDEKAATITLEMPWWPEELHAWGMDIPADPNLKPYVITLKMEDFTSSRLTLVTPQGNVNSMRKY